MQGVGTGRVIAGRYGLQERRAHQGDLEVWSATDTVAHRPVVVTVFPLSLPHAEATLDAARRAAVVDDPRLVAVLDVGSEHGIAWIVEESLTSSTTLAALLQDGPLGSEESRRIIGEVASALDVAGRRGLHHLHLSPYAVRRTREGHVKLAGLATAAAIEGTEEISPQEAAAADTHGLLAVLYAALTARWPLEGGMPGLADAPRIVGGVAAPSEIAADVPADLDLLCRTTLNGDPGPATPGELAAQIAPWSEHVVDGAVPHGDDDSRDGQAPLMPMVPMEPPAPTEPQALIEPQAPTEPLTAVQAATPERDATPDSDAAADNRAAPEGDMAPDTDTARESDTDPNPGIIGRWRGLASTAGQRVRAARASAQDPGSDRVTLRSVLDDGPSAPPPPPIPLATASATHRDGENARLTLGIIAGLIVIAMLIAVPTLFSSVTSTASSTAPPTATTTAPAARSTAPTSKPLTIQTATGFDPLGDGTENGSQARRTYDGDPSTVWTSEGYRGSAEFGGTKEGVGVIYTLATGSKVSAATLTLATKPQDVTVYVSTDRSLDGAEELGKITNATGERTVQASAPLTGRYVIVWFTKAAHEEGERYRCSLAEVAFF